MQHHNPGIHQAQFISFVFYSCLLGFDRVAVRLVGQTAAFLAQFVISRLKPMRGAIRITVGGESETSLFATGS